MSDTKFWDGHTVTNAERVGAAVELTTVCKQKFALPISMPMPKLDPKRSAGPVTCAACQTP